MHNLFYFGYSVDPIASITLSYSPFSIKKEIFRQLSNILYLHLKIKRLYWLLGTWVLDHWKNWKRRNLMVSF